MFFRKKILVGFVLLILLQQACFIAYVKSSASQQNALVAMLVDAASMSEINFAMDVKKNGMQSIAHYFGTANADELEVIFQEENAKFKRATQHLTDVTHDEFATVSILADIAILILPALIIFAMFFFFFRAERFKLGIAILFPPVGFLMMIYSSMTDKKDQLGNEEKSLSQT